MHSIAIYQIVAALASMALITLPAAEALPVRGALGNLGARARAAKRAAHYHQQQQEALQQLIVPSAPVAETASSFPVIAFAKRFLTATQPKAQPVLAARAPAQFAVKENKVGAVNPKASASAAPQFRKRDTIADELKKMNPKLSAAIGAVPTLANAAVVLPEVEAAPAVDQASVYEAYLSAMNAPATSSTEEIEVAPTSAIINAVVPSPSASPAVEQQEVYDSYIAELAAPTTGLWATYTPSASSPVKL